MRSLARKLQSPPADVVFLAPPAAHTPSEALPERRGAPMIAAKNDCMLLIKDVIDHLSQCCDHCQSGDEAVAQHLLATMQRDVHEIQRLCNRLDSEPAAASESIAMAM
jgi:hypothetical protein